MIYTKKLQDDVEEMQKELHSFADQVLENTKKTKYADAVTMFFLTKICQIEEKLEKLGKNENKVSVN